MAVVAEYKLKNCTASIHDDAFAGITEEENARRIREIQRTAWRIWDAQWARKMQEDSESGTGGPSRAPAPTRRNDTKEGDYNGGRNVLPVREL